MVSRGMGPRLPLGRLKRLRENMLCMRSYCLHWQFDSWEYGVTTKVFGEIHGCVNRALQDLRRPGDIWTTTELNSLSLHIEVHRGRSLVDISMWCCELKPASPVLTRARRVPTCRWESKLTRGVHILNICDCVILRVEVIDSPIYHWLQIVMRCAHGWGGRRET